MHTPVYAFHMQLSQNIDPLLNNCKIFGLLQKNFLKIRSRLPASPRRHL